LRDTMNGSPRKSRSGKILVEIFCRNVP
jgi:hypothetical protein